MELGDSNELFIIVKAGLKEGDEVILNPLAFIEQAQTDVLQPVDVDQSRQDASEQTSASKEANMQAQN